MKFTTETQNAPTLFDLDFQRAAGDVFFGLLYLFGDVRWKRQIHLNFKISVGEGERNGLAAQDAFGPRIEHVLNNVFEFVYLRADDRASYGDVVRVVAVIRNAGVRNLGLVAEDESGR